jgi:hypothetical protein
MAQVDALLERARALRWLRPDSAMARWDAEAQAFVEDRMDEHRHALAHYAEDPSAPPEPELLLERSLYDARFASGYFGDDWRTWGEPQPAFSPDATRWIRALDRARATVLSEARARLGSAACATIVEAALTALRTRRKDADRGDNALVQRLRGIIYQGRTPDTALAPGGELLLYESLRVALADDALPSPWAPVLSLWERGAAALASLDGALLLYVPVLSGSTLVAEPTPGRAVSPHDWRADRAGREGVAQWRQEHGYFQPGHRFMPREWETPGVTALFATIYRFARHGFAPLPGMMLHAVDASPQFVATNTPALALSTYVPRLPSAPVGPQEFDAMVDAPDTDKALLERATPEGLAKQSMGFW